MFTRHLIATLLLLVLAALCNSQELIIEDDFGAGLAKWQFTDGPDGVWSVSQSQDADDSCLRVAGKSAYQPPFRSPHSIAWLKDIDVGDFQIDVRLQSTNVNAGPHRDLCVFWGRQSASKFYYVHLGAKSDPHACQIFIVNDAAREAITTNNPTGIPWTERWHKVRVTYESNSGSIKVFFDDMDTPVMTAKDKTFAHGQVGLGTFDDHGNFDDFELRGAEID